MVSLKGVRQTNWSKCSRALITNRPKVWAFCSLVGGSPMLFFVTRDWAILTTQTRDIQCEKFIEHETVSHEQCNSMYPNIY